jgi:photosystem II stability/assembly factor-like uncharacterized protein
MRALAMVSADEGWAAGFNGALFHYHNGAWTSASSPIAPAAGQFTSLEIECIAMVSANEGWAVGGGVDADGFLLHYDGAQWARAPSPLNNHLSGVAMLSADEGWAVGWSGALLRYHAGNWTPVQSPTTKDLIAVAIVSADEAWAVGDGVILRERGGVWTQATTVGPLFESVALTAPGEGWAVGVELNAGGSGHEESVIYHLRAGQWREITSPTHAPLDSVAMTSATDGWAVGWWGTILHYHDGGWEIAATTP